MAAMLRCRNFAESLRAACRKHAHQTKSSRQMAGCFIKPAAERRPLECERYPPHANGEDARSITFIMRLPFGIIDMLRL